MLQLHFIAVADWWTAAQTTREHLYPLPGCKKQQNNKTTKHNGLITVFIVRPPNQLQMTRCVGADRVSNCCHMFVLQKQTSSSLVLTHSLYYMARLRSTVQYTDATFLLKETSRFCWDAPTYWSDLHDDVAWYLSCTESWDVLRNVLRMGKCCVS